MIPSLLVGALAGRTARYPVFLDAGAGAREVPGAGGSLEIPYPATVNAGDWLVAIVYFQDATGANAVSVPTGWTQLGNALANAGVTLRAYLIYKKADGTETGNLSVTLTDANVDVFSAGRMFRFSGVRGIDVSSEVMTDASDTAVPLPSITPTRARVLLVGIIAANGAATFSVGGSGYTEDVAEYNPGANIMFGFETKKLETPAVASDNGTIGTSRTHRARFQFALYG